MKKRKKTILNKYRKEVLVLLMGSSLVVALLLNLKNPEPKRELASAFKHPPLSKAKTETKLAAKKVQEEQEQQSLMLLDFKRDYMALLKTKNCLKTQNCDYPNTDPREYSLAVSKKLSVQLKNLKPALISNWFRLNSKVRTEIVSSIRLEDGFVKEQVLDLLLSLNLNESKEHLPLVLDEVIDHYNSELIPKAFEFIKKTTTPKNEVKLAKRIAQAILSGGPHSSQALSKDISLIISPNTAEIFKEVLSSLPEQALETELLTSALSEFELKQSGG